MLRQKDTRAGSTYWRKGVISCSKTRERERERVRELFVLKAKWSGMEGKEGDAGMPVCPKNKRKTGWVD